MYHLIYNVIYLFHLYERKCRERKYFKINLYSWLQEIGERHMI